MIARMDGFALARRWAAGETQESLAREVGVSRQRVAQLIERAMGRDWMREQMARRSEAAVTVEVPPPADSSLPERECVVCTAPTRSKSYVPLCGEHKRWYSQVRRLVVPGVREKHNALMRGRKEAQRPRAYRSHAGSVMQRLIDESREKGGLLARVVDN